MTQNGKMSELIARLEEDDIFKLQRKLPYDDNEEHDGSDSTKIPANKKECSICREYQDTSKFGATYHILFKLNDNISRTTSSVLPRTATLVSARMKLASCSNRTRTF